MSNKKVPNFMIVKQVAEGGDKRKMEDKLLH